MFMMKRLWSRIIFTRNILVFIAWNISPLNLFFDTVEIMICPCKGLWQIFCLYSIFKALGFFVIIFSGENKYSAVFLYKELIFGFFLYYRRSRCFLLQSANRALWNYGLTFSQNYYICRQQMLLAHHKAASAHQLCAGRRRLSIWAEAEN